jgi:DNA-binding NtrC family response regulator
VREEDRILGDDTDAETRVSSRVEALERATVPGVTVLAHPEVHRVGERAAWPEMLAGRPVFLSRLEPGFAQPGEPGLAPLAEPHLSRRPIVLRPGAEGSVELDRSATPTTVLANGQSVGEGRIFPAEQIAAGVVLLLGEAVVLLLHRFRPVFEPGIAEWGLVGKSDAILEVARQARRVADLDVPVLLRGETGTGKELLAQAIHGASPRRERPYVPVNVAAIPASLAAAELFGATKGAYTGADHPRPGLFRRAHQGTLFLDEIGELPLDVQPLLLRALESGEIQPVGSPETVTVDVRILAATDADLEAAIAAGRFRSPLLHRLAGYEIRLPSLAERRDDIGRLLIHFLRQELAALGEEGRLAPSQGRAPWLPAGLVAALALHPWTGNVRQLRNVARHLAVDSRGAQDIEIGPAVERLLRGGGAGDRRAAAGVAATPVADRARRVPRQISDDEVIAALQANRWNPGAAARQLGISRPALYLRIDASPKLRKAADLDGPEIERAIGESGGRLDEAAEQLRVSADALRRQMRRLGLR